MVKKTGIIKNLINQETVKYFLDYYEKLPKKDNGLRWNADTLVEQDFNHRLKEKLQNIIKGYIDGEICHCTIYSDYAPGGIHSDGYIEAPEKYPLSYTILIPLVSEYKENATVIFNESSERAITFNEATGLGNKGIRSYEQEQLPEGNSLSENFIKTYFPHLSVNQLPFTLDSVLYWDTGSALYWPRERFHASAYFPQNTIRKAMVILTNEN
jgi:hypothetical protein